MLRFSELGDIEFFKRGKVRDVYDLGSTLLVIATDRISAFDHVMPNGIPDKGRILTAMSLFWFRFLSDLSIQTHLISAEIDQISCLSSLSSETQKQ